MSFQPQSASRIAILGRTGSGKTVLSKTLQSCYPRVLIIDMVKDYAPDGETHFFSRFAEFSAFLLRYQHAERLRVVFQFDIHERDYLGVAEEIFALAYDWGNCLVNVDECQYFDHSHYLKQLILVGRRRNIATLCSTQRPANLSKDIVSQSSDLFVGTLFETNDLKYLKDSLNPEDIQKVSSIPPHHFLHYRPGHPSQIVKNR